MSNEPTTYFLLVELPGVYGETADHVAEELENFLQNESQILDRDEMAYEPTVVHLTPETLPGRYIERAAVIEWLRSAPTGISGVRLDIQP